MLLLKRVIGETIIIDGGIKIIVMEIQNGQVRLGVFVGVQQFPTKVYNPLKMSKLSSRAAQGLPDMAYTCNPPLNYPALILDFLNLRKQSNIEELLSNLVFNNINQTAT